MEPITGIFKQHHIRGRILLGSSPLRNVPVNLTGPETQSTVSNDYGEYFFIVKNYGIYTVTPFNEPYYHFSPLNASADVEEGNVDSIDFQATAGAGYIISGTITSGGNPLPGVQVELTKNSNLIDSEITDINGYYEVHPNSNGLHQITPTKSGYSFAPTEITVDEEELPISGQDFVGTINYVEFEIFGHSYRNDSPRIGFPVYLRQVDQYAQDAIAPNLPSASQLYEDAVTDYFLHDDDSATSLVWAVSSAGFLSQLWLQGVPEGTQNAPAWHVPTSNDYRFIVKDGIYLWLAGATDDKVARIRVTEDMWNSQIYELTEFHHGQGTNGFNHGAYDPSGKIWLAPKNSSNIVSIHPISGATGTLAHGQAGTDLFSKAISDPDNNAIWLIPKNAQNIIRVNCLNNTITVIPFNSPTTSNFLDALITDNRLYLIPHNYNYVIRIDLTTLTLTYAAAVTHKYNKGLVDNFGWIWMFGSFVEAAENAVAKIRITNDELDLRDILTEPVVALQDDIIWMARSTGITKINTLTNFSENIDYDSGSVSNFRFSNIIQLTEGRNPALINGNFKAGNSVLYFVAHDEELSFRLWRDCDWSNPPINTTTTNSQGEYSFSVQVVPGSINNYFVELDSNINNRQGLYVTLDATDDLDNDFNIYGFNVSGVLNT